MEIIEIPSQTSLWRISMIPNDVPDNKLEDYRYINCSNLYHSNLQSGHFANGIYFSTLPLVDGENIIENRVGYLQEGGRGAIIEVIINVPIHCIFYDETKGEQDVPNMINEIEARLGLRNCYPRVPENFPFIEWLSSIHHVFKDVDSEANIYEIIFPHRLLLPVPLFRQVSHGIWKRNFKGMYDKDFIRVLE